MTTTLCSCCIAEVPAPVIRTALGRFDSPYAICAKCWAKVPLPLRRLLKVALVGYRHVPSLERALKVYEVFLLCIGERSAVRVAA